MNVGLVLQNGLIYGTVLSLLLSLVILGSLFINAEMWLRDYPPDIKERYGESSEKAKKQWVISGVLFFFVATILIIISTVQLATVISGKLGFQEIILNTFVMLLVFNVVDLLILDWLIFVIIRPRFVILPGTEGMAGYNDYRFHFVGFLKGLVLILGVSLITAVVTLLIQTL
jgi:hypothetical protein